MTKKKSEPVVDAAFAPVVAAFARNRQVVVARGWGAGNTVLKVKGKIFAMSHGGELVVKIDTARAAELVGAKQATFFDPRRDGRLMKEWVVVEPRKLDWVELAREAHRFVGGA